MKSTHNLTCRTVRQILPHVVISGGGFRNLSAFAIRISNRRKVVLLQASRFVTVEKVGDQIADFACIHLV